MTAVWGKPLWSAIHSFTLVYPLSPSEADKQHAADYFNTLPIPCGSCMVKYKQMLAVNPVEAALDSRAALVTWAFDVHNEVNDSIGKVRFTTDEFIVKYGVTLTEDGEPCPSLGTRLVGNAVWLWQSRR